MIKLKFNNNIVYTKENMETFQKFIEKIEKINQGFTTFHVDFYHNVDNKIIWTFDYKRTKDKTDIFYGEDIILHAIEKIEQNCPMIEKIEKIVFSYSPYQKDIYVFDMLIKYKDIDYTTLNIKNSLVNIDNELSLNDILKIEKAVKFLNH